MYGAEKVTMTRLSQLQKHLNTALQGATKLSNADRHKTNEQFEHGIHLVTLVKPKLLFI